MRIVKEKDKEKKRVYTVKTEKQKTTEMIIYFAILLLLLSYGFYVSFIRDNTSYEDEEKTVQEVTQKEPTAEPTQKPTVIINDEPTEDKAMEDMFNHFLEDNDVSEKVDDFTDSFH